MPVRFSKIVIKLRTAVIRHPDLCDPVFKPKNGSQKMKIGGNQPEIKLNSNGSPVYLLSDIQLSVNVLITNNLGRFWPFNSRV